MKSLIMINILFIILFLNILYLDIKVINYYNSHKEIEYNYNIILEEEFQDD